MKNLLYLFIALTLFSCDEIPQADVSGVIKEKRNRMLQKVSKGDIFHQAVKLGRNQIESGNTHLIKNTNEEGLTSLEKEIFEMYVEASKENYKDNNIQFYDNDKWVLYNEPYYEGEQFIGIYSVQLEAAEVIRTMQKPEVLK
jgi:hypothetical protein